MPGQKTCKKWPFVLPFLRRSERHTNQPAARTHKPGDASGAAFCILVTQITEEQRGQSTAYGHDTAATAPERLAHTRLSTDRGPSFQRLAGAARLLGTPYQCRLKPLAMGLVMREHLADGFPAAYRAHNASQNHNGARQVANAAQDSRETSMLDGSGNGRWASQGGWTAHGFRSSQSGPVAEHAETGHVAITPAKHTPAHNGYQHFCTADPIFHTAADLPRLTVAGSSR